MLSKLRREDFSLLYYSCKYYQNGIHKDEFGNSCIDLFDDEVHSKLERFFNLDEKNNIICNKFGLKDFEISAVKIVKIIDNKLNSQKFSNLISSEIKDDNNINRDFEEKIQNKYSVPQIIKILDKLNIKGMMGEKGFTDFQTVQLLADIFGRSEKSIRNNFDSDTHKNTAETYISELKNLKAKR